jgi:hypothetical protein
MMHIVRGFNIPTFAFRGIDSGVRSSRSAVLSYSEAPQSQLSQESSRKSLGLWVTCGTRSCLDPLRPLADSRAPPQLSRHRSARHLETGCPPSIIQIYCLRSRLKLKIGESVPVISAPLENLIDKRMDDARPSDRFSAGLYNIYEAVSI